MYKSFNDMIQKAKSDKPRRVALANGADASSLAALCAAGREGIVNAILVGVPEDIQGAARSVDVDISQMEIVECAAEESALKAVSLVAAGEADILMKGSVKTSDFMKAVLDREKGLRSGELLSHAFIYECPVGNMLRIVTDGGINIKPDLNQKVEILKNAVRFSRALGVKQPKVAVLAAVEAVNPKMQETVDAVELMNMAQAGEFGDCVVEGPLALDLAVSERAAATKKVGGQVPGRADVLLVPDICSGNVLGKSLIYYGAVPNGGMVVGSSAPVVFLSRADEEDTKLNSIALGAAVQLR